MYSLERPVPTVLGFLTRTQLVVGWMVVTVKLLLMPSLEWFSIFSIFSTLFHTFPTFSDLLTGQAVAKVCSPVTYKDKAESPSAVG